MRAVAIGLVLLMAARAPAVRADPDAPQISPIRAQREDAQRLSEQLRGLEREPSRPAPPAAPAPATKPAPVPPPAQVQPAQPQPLAQPAQIGASPVRDAPGARKPLVRQWWFWGAIGALAVTAIGVTYATQTGGAPDFPGVRCDPTGCR